MNLFLLISLSAAIPVLQGESLLQSEGKILKQFGNLHLIGEGDSAKIVSIDSLRKGESHIINIKDDFSPSDFNLLLLTKEANMQFLSQDQTFRKYLTSEEFRKFIIKNPTLLKNHNLQEIGALGKLIGYPTLLEAYPPLFKILLDDPEFLKYARSKEFTHGFLQEHNIFELMRKSGANQDDIVKLAKPEPDTRAQKAWNAMGWN